MTATRRISPQGLALIKSFEGFRARAARIGKDRWTIGYGHTKTARADAVISRDDAEALLRYDLDAVEQTVAQIVYAPLTQPQFDALVSFAANIGLGAFQGSEVLARINQGDNLGAAAAMDAWRRAKVHGRTIVVDALVRRRAAEKALFLTAEPMPVAPSVIIKPELDIATSILTSQERAETVTVPLDGEEAGPIIAGATDNASPPLRIEAAARSTAEILRDIERRLVETPQPTPPAMPALVPAAAPAPDKAEPASFSPAAPAPPADPQPEASAPQQNLAPEPGPPPFDAIDLADPATPATAAPRAKPFDPAADLRAVRENLRKQADALPVEPSKPSAAPVVLLVLAVIGLMVAAGAGLLILEPQLGPAIPEMTKWLVAALGGLAFLVSVFYLVTRTRAN